MHLVRLLLFLLLLYGLSLPFYLLLRRRRSVQLAGWFAHALIVLPLPLLWPPGEPFTQCLFAIFCGITVCKTWDLLCGARRGHQPGFRTFVGFLPNNSTLVERRTGAEPRPPTAVNLKRLLRGLLELALGVGALTLAFKLELGQYSFLLDHTVKVFAFYPALDGGTMVIVSLLRLCGVVGRDVLHDPILARTPAEFWRLYNRPVNQFFQEDVFRPNGGFRAPARGVLLVFLISGLLHEYIFAITLGRIQIYQMAFFMLHGVAVLATLRIKPKGWQAVLWTAATLIFNLASLTLFAASVHQVITFYSHGTPLL